MQSAEHRKPYETSVLIYFVLPLCTDVKLFFYICLFWYRDETRVTFCIQQITPVTKINYRPYSLVPFRTEVSMDTLTLVPRVGDDRVMG